MTTDLSQFSLASFSRVELNRGGVPLELGGAGVASALHLVTRLRPTDRTRPLLVSAGGGSFTSRHARLRWFAGNDTGTFAHRLDLSYRGSEGDFSFYDDGGTNLDPTDDQERSRVNNDYQQYGLGSRSRISWRGNELTVGARARRQQQGVVGSVQRPSARARLNTASLLVDAHLRAPHRIGHATVLSYAFAEDQRYRDPLGEIGLGTDDRHYSTLATGLTGGSELVVSPKQTCCDPGGHSSRSVSRPRSIDGRRATQGVRLSPGRLVWFGIDLAASALTGPRRAELAGSGDSNARGKRWMTARSGI